MGTSSCCCSNLNVAFAYGDDGVLFADNILSVAELVLRALSAYVFDGAKSRPSSLQDLTIQVHPLSQILKQSFVIIRSLETALTIIFRRTTFAPAAAVC